MVCVVEVVKVKVKTKAEVNISPNDPRQERTEQCLTAGDSTLDLYQPSSSSEIQLRYCKYMQCRLLV